MQVYTRREKLLLALLVVIGAVAIALLLSWQPAPRVVRVTAESARQFCYQEKCWLEVWFGYSSKYRIMAPVESGIAAGDKFRLLETCSAMRALGCSYSYVGQ